MLQNSDLGAGAKAVRWASQCHHLLAAWLGAKVQTSARLSFLICPVGILGISDRQPSTTAMGQVPFSIYWSFLDGAAKGYRALQKEAEPVDPRSMATTKQLPPKDRSDNGSAGEEAAHCHSEGPANHLVQYSRLSPPAATDNKNLSWNTNMNNSKLKSCFPGLYLFYKLKWIYYLL